MLELPANIKPTKPSELASACLLLPSGLQIYRLAEGRSEKKTRVQQNDGATDRLGERERHFEPQQQHHQEQWWW